MCHCTACRHDANMDRKNIFLIQKDSQLRLLVLALVEGYLLRICLFGLFRSLSFAAINAVPSDWIG